MLGIKFLTTFFSVALAGLLFLNVDTPSDSQTDFKYVGATTCVGACHKSEAQGKQLDIWKESKHSQAFKTLQTQRADSIAGSRGFTTAAAETPECIKCHVLGKEIVESELSSTFDKTDGVQCESCHGPGSEYKKISIMKDKQKAAENGLILHNEGELFCTNCHNAESPTFAGFFYDTYLEKIKHSIPKKD